MRQFIQNISSSSLQPKSHNVERPFRLWIATLSFVVILIALGSAYPIRPTAEGRFDERLELSAMMGNLPLLRSTWADEQTTGWAGDEPPTHLGRALRAAASGGNEAMVSQLLQWGADPNATSPIGQTPLMCAAGVKNSAAVARRLIAAGANVNAGDPHGRTAIMAAMAAHDSELLAVLCERGGT
jgi:hypothetical protein